MSLRKIADYTITRELGRGGMGTVFQALSPEGATVAVKTVLWPEGVDPRDRWEAIERFQREARAASSLTHPNVCQVLDFGADEDSLYIVMEFLDGETVHDLIALAGGIKVPRAVEIVRDVAEGLGHAHEQGIIHRDVKPHNIMVLRAGQVKLTDFGVASVLRETTLTTSGRKMGTVCYMSPEQVQGEKLDARSDIFSLGVTFYEMLAGRRPFEAEESAAVMNQILTKDPPPIPGLPSQLSEVLQRCLCKDPQERFQSTREVVTSLSAAGIETATGSTAVISEDQPESAAARPHRRPWLPRALTRWPVLAMAAGVLALGAVLLLRPGPSPTGEPTVVPRFPPSLRPLQPGLVATYHYGGMDRVGGIAVKPDGTVLVTVGETEEIPPGVYVARPGDDWDPTDAYTQPGAPFVSPGGIAVHPDGRVVVADREASTVWVIPRAGARAEPLTTEVPSPCDVVVAPQGFDGPDVDPGDFLVCAGSPAGPDAFGLYSVDAVTGAVRHLTGPADLANGLLWADFGPDGTLYAVEDDRNTRDGLTIVTISPDGGATSFVGNATLTYPGQPMAGPMTVHPTTGDFLAAYRSTIYRLPAGWQPGAPPEVYAEQGLEITALEFNSDGSSLLVGDAGEDVLAKIAPCPIEGKLLISGGLELATMAGPRGFKYFLEGTSDRLVEVPRSGEALSPLADELVYHTYHPYPADKPWLARPELWKVDLRDQSEVNLTEAAGLRGVSCKALWSPGARWIAFMHCDPIKDAKPCETGFDIWVMRADGAEAHRVVGAGPEMGERPPSECMPTYSWSVNGDRVIYRYGFAGPVMSCDLDGTDRQAFPAFPGNMSPDGSKIVDGWVEPGTSEGEPGAWRQLRLTNSDGSGRQTLIEHFVRDSDVVEHLRLLGEENPEDPRWLDDVREWVGPRQAKWSPKGDRVAFLAALPSLDPQGVHYKLQSEVWIYELATGILTKLAREGEYPTLLSWRGPNTYPEHPQVTVGTATLTFSEVAGEGLTTVIRDDDRPAEPGGYRFGEDYYDIRTTAQYKGPVTIAMTYADEDLADGNEKALAILRYDEARGEWEDVTTSRDPTKNIVYGEVDSL